jgi:hypothetical protein
MSRSIGGGVSFREGGGGREKGKRGEGRGKGRRATRPRARHAQHEHALRTSTGSRGSRKREYLGQYRCPCAPACPACVPLPAPPLSFYRTGNGTVY